MISFQRIRVSFFSSRYREEDTLTSEISLINFPYERTISTRFSELFMCLLFLKNNELKKSLRQRGIFWSGIFCFQSSILQHVSIHSCYVGGLLVADSEKQKQKSPGRCRVLQTKGPRWFYLCFLFEGVHTHTNTHTSTSLRELGVIRLISSQSTECTQISSGCYGTMCHHSCNCAKLSYQPVRTGRFSFCWNTSKCKAIKEEKSIDAGRDRNYVYSQ